MRFVSLLNDASKSFEKPFYTDILWESSLPGYHYQRFGN